MLDTTGEYWRLEFTDSPSMPPNSGRDNTQGITGSALFEEKTAAKAAGERLVGCDHSQWESGDCERSERIQLDEGVVRVTPETLIIHAEGEIPQWIEWYQNRGLPQWTGE